MQHTSIIHCFAILALSCLCFSPSICAFLVPKPFALASTRPATKRDSSHLSSSNGEAKRRLLGLIGKQGYIDSVLSDPETKEPLRVVTSGLMMGGDESRTKLLLQSTTNSYKGSSNSFIDLLEPFEKSGNSAAKENSAASQVVKTLASFIPSPLRCKFAVFNKQIILVGRRI